MKLLKLLAILITGTIFMFSGFVKGVDPLGSAYKFHDYFNAFGLSFLNFLTLPLAVLLCTAEFMAGFSVITGIMRKWGIILVTILMAIFTPLTFVLALTNPVSDCGCFGDAIRLTNWQTFIKNIILLIPVLFLLFQYFKPGFLSAPSFEGPRKAQAPPGGFGGKNTSGNFIKSMKKAFKGASLGKNTSGNVTNLMKGYFITSSIGILFIAFCIYNLVYLPVIDFLPYKKGTRIAENMSIPEGASPDIYKTTFIYEKEGVKKEFSLEDYPADDSTWKFIDQKSVLVKKGYEPPIHDFVITDAAGEDVTGKILDNDCYTLLMIAKKLREADEKQLMRGFEAGRYIMNKGMNFYVLTASGSDEIKKYDAGIHFCTADETTLKTMIRSNPGYILIKNGVITGKWSWANLPGKADLKFEK